MLPDHRPRVITHDIHSKRLSRIVDKSGPAVPFAKFMRNLANPGSANHCLRRTFRRAPTNPFQLRRAAVCRR